MFLTHKVINNLVKLIQQIKCMTQIVFGIIKDPLKNKPQVINPGFAVNGLRLNYF